MPHDWCLDFNLIVNVESNKIRVDPGKSTHIEMWVRDMDEISDELDLVKRNIKRCNHDYNEKFINRKKHVKILRAAKSVKKASG